MPTRKQAKAADGDLILKLYELRREGEMRKARDFMMDKFWPDSLDDIMRIVQAFGTDENRYMRQVFGYWDMACSLVLRGALNEDLFFDCSSEMYPLFAKVRPFIKAFREKVEAPDAFRNIERVVMNTQQSRQRLEHFEKRLARWKELVASQTKQ